MQKLVLITMLLSSVICMSLRQCNPSLCKNVATDCMEQPGWSNSSTQLISCLKDLKIFVAQDNSVQQFEDCMNKSVSTGKLMGCAKTQCPNSAAQFITMIFNQAQQKSYISIDF